VVYRNVQSLVYIQRGINQNLGFNDNKFHDQPIRELFSNLLEKIILDLWLFTILSGSRTIEEPLLLNEWCLPR